MIYGANGKPVGEVNKKATFRYSGEDIDYKVLPKDEMHEGIPFATPKIGYIEHTYPHNGKNKKVAILMKYEIQVEESIPDNLRPIFALHEHLHKKDMTHAEIFPHELALAKELGVTKDYIRFMAREDVFRIARECNDYGSELKPGEERHMSGALRRETDAELWMEIKNDELVELIPKSHEIYGGSK
jgi:hypothetical protein